MYVHVHGKVNEAELVVRSTSKGNVLTTVKHGFSIMAHINTIITDTLDPIQFAYSPNRSTEDAIFIALHTALSHLDKRNTYVRMLFIDFYMYPLL